MGTCFTQSARARRGRPLPERVEGTSHAASVSVCPSEYLIETEPEDGAGPGPEADGLGEVDAERGAFEEGEERDVDAEADADAVDDLVPLALEVSLADVVEDRADEVAERDGVVEHVAVDLAPERIAPLEGHQP